MNTLLSPLVVYGLGLPKELGITLIFGFLRKELSLVMMLHAPDVGYHELFSAVSREQILVFSVFVSFLIPCLSTFAVLWEEMGKKSVAFLSAALSIAAAMLFSLLVRVIF